MIRKTTILSIALFIGTLPFAQAQTESDSMAKILGEIQSLREKVESLESRLAKLESASANPVRISDTMDEKERVKWINHLRVDLRKAEAKAVGGWTEAANWQKIPLKMREDEALEILGEPTRSKFSVRKDTDMIHIYEGDLDGTGKIIEGEIRIYKGKVSDILVPAF